MKLDQIRALIEAATPGPWLKDTQRRVVTADNRMVVAGESWEADPVGRSEVWLLEKDAAFIAASRDLMPKLLASARCLERLLLEIDTVGAGAIGAEFGLDDFSSLFHDGKAALAALEAE